MKRKINLVEYTDSEASDNENKKKVEKKLKGSNESHYIYPINLEGNFPSFVYIDIEANSLIESIQNEIFQAFKGKYEPIILKNIHISLSQTFFLNLHQIAAFLNKMESKQIKMLLIIFIFLIQCIENLFYFQKFYVRLNLKDCDIFLSQNGDQFFAILKIQEKESIILIIKEIDQILQSYNFPPLFFDNYVPHISLVSAQINQDSIVFDENKTVLKKILKGYVNKNIEFLISTITCKIGERTTNIKLK